MKINMKSIEEKSVSGAASHNNSSTNPKIRIAVFGQHEVGKSALTVRYLTRRYIGEYKSNTDMLYRQTMTVSHGHSLDIEIVDISTSEESYSSSNCDSTSSVADRKTFPMKEMQRADGFIIVYSITDRSSFTFALEALAKLSNYYSKHNQTQQQLSNSKSTSTSNSPPPSHSTTKSSVTLPVVLLANKNDLEHLRTVEKVEGLSASMQFSTHFYELSVAENSPEVYQSFQTIISTFAEHQPSKRKFSVSKMLGNLRLGRTSPSQQVAVGQASIIDTSYESSSDSTNDEPSSTLNNSISSDSNSYNNPGKNHGSACRQSSSNASEKETSGNNLTNSICHLKSKLVEFHSMKKRHNSPPICSL